LRGIKTGDKIPQFSATELSGAEFDYKHGIGKVLVAAFLTTEQKQSERAAADLQKITQQLAEYADQIQFLVVTTDPKTQDYFGPAQKAPEPTFHILLDPEYKLWGRFGVIVTPTLVVADKTDTLKWVKAGYSYEFAPAARLQIELALGIADPNDSPGRTQVRTLENATERANVERYLSMAKTLEEKGRLESAIREILEAQQLDPNSIDVRLQLGQLYCKTGKADAALGALAKAKPQNRVQQAQVKLTLGWSNRLLGKLDAAQKLLLEAARLDPKSARAFFELGRVYLAAGEKDKAIEAYQKALTLVLGE
jgi:tetratricopeptide (TPR) repeat protein